MPFLIDWSAALTDAVSNLIVAGLTALFGLFFVKRYVRQLNFSNKMQQLGFVNTSTTKQSKAEIAKMCQTAQEIKLINVSGFHYLNANEDLLKRALQRGVKIKFLCCHPTSRFLTDIERMEYFQVDSSGKRMREADQPISREIYDLIEKYRAFGLEMRFYSTEYRLPYVLAYYADGTVKAWLTMTLPPYKSTKSFVLRGEKKGDQLYDEDANFIDMMETNFDTIWEHSTQTLEQILPTISTETR